MREAAVIRRRFDRDTLEGAIRLREQGLQWKEINEIYGRSGLSLQVTVANYLKGKWPDKQRPLREARERLTESLVESGISSLKDISRRLGVSVPYACQIARRIGFDAEMRAEAALNTTENRDA